MNIIHNPPDNWIRCLREGNQIWLVKENAVAIVASPYIPPEHARGGICGDLFIMLSNRMLACWLVRSNGNGIDNKPIIRPIKGHLPSTPIELKSKEAVELAKEIVYLKNANTALSKRIYDLEIALGIRGFLRKN